MTCFPFQVRLFARQWRSHFFCHSGMIKIISQNELSPVLIMVFPSRYQHLDSNRNSSASQYSTTAWKKLNEKVGRIREGSRDQISFVEHLRVPCHSHLIQLAHCLGTAAALLSPYSSSCQKQCILSKAMSTQGGKGNIKCNEIKCTIFNPFCLHLSPAQCLSGKQTIPWISSF